MVRYKWKGNAVAKKKQTTLLFSEQLVQAIESSDLTRYRIAKESGVAQSTLSQFVNCNRALPLANINKVCELLDLELVPRK